MDTLNSLPPKLLQRVAATMRRRDYSPRTIESYTYRIRFYIRYHSKTHPEQMGAPQVEAFLTYPANERISASPLDRI